MSDPIAIAWVQQVGRCTEPDLPNYIRQGVLSRPEAAGPLLFALIDDLAIWDTMAAVHIVSLLGELRYEPAIHFLVDLLWDEPDLEGPHEALVKFGEKAVPFLMLNVGRFPEEVLPTLVAIAPDDPTVMAELLRALEALDDTNPANRGQIVALTDAIRDLGGELGVLASKSDNVRTANAQRLARLAMQVDKRQKKRRRSKRRR